MGVGVSVMYAVMGLIVTGIRVYNVLELSKYLNNFENEVVGGQIKFIELILTTFLGWPVVLCVSIYNNKRGWKK